MTMMSRGANLCARLSGPLQPRLEAGMAAAVTLAAYPPWACPLREEVQRDPGLAVPTARLIPVWTAICCGDEEDRAAPGRFTPSGSGRYPRRSPPEIDRGRFGSRYHQDAPGTVRAAAGITGWLTLTAQNRYMGPLTERDLDACVAHLASRVPALGVTRYPDTWAGLAGYYELLIDGHLQGTEAGREVLAVALRADDIGGYPGVLLAARSLWLLDRRATDALEVPLPWEVGPRDAPTGNYCPRS